MHAVRSMTLAAVALFLLGIPARSDENIEWRVAFPVTLFDDYAAHPDVRKNQYLKLQDKELNKLLSNWNYRRDMYVHADCMSKQDPVLCSEQKLHSFRIGMMTRHLSKEQLISRGNDLLSDVHLTSASDYLAHKRRYDRGRLRDIWRDSVKIEARVLRPPPNAASCKMSVLNKARSIVTTAEGSCGEWLALALPRGVKSTLRAELYDRSGGQIARHESTSTDIRELTVVGLGDSYASGEGNPDVPAVLERGSDGWPRRPKHGADGTKGEAAVRERANGRSVGGSTAAGWLDRPCHRSLLGPQVRAVVQLAAENPHLHITFMHLACTGAAIRDGILDQYSDAVAEHNIHYNQLEKSAPLRNRISQINQVIEILCPDIVDSNGTTEMTKFLKKSKRHNIYACKSKFYREIDAVMLSAGGNDVGFLKLILYVVLGEFERWGAGFTKVKPMSPADVGKRIGKELRNEYERLDEVFEKHLRIENAGAVLVAQYPSPNFRLGREYCYGKGGHLEAFDLYKDSPLSKVPGFPPEVSKKESADVERLVLVPLNKEIARAPRRKGRKWTVVSGHMEKFIGKGWCVGRDVRDIAGKNLKDFNPYGIAERWFRTPNDSVFTQNQKRSGGDGDGGRIKEKAILTFGMFHPNNFGAAATADAYLVELRKLLTRKYAQ